LLGHKGVVPVSWWGRLLAASAMIASILLLSLLTGVIASVLTIRQFDSGISHPSDLRYARVVSITSSTSADYLRRRRIAFQTRPTARAALQAVIDRQADAAVYDEALLKYLANTEFAESIQVLPISFNTQEYAIALRPNSPLRKPINGALLRYRASDGWDDLLYRYLGE
jgi:ABC-type amino acid transport substrate-binding protein